MRADVALLGIAVIVSWGLWGFLYKLGILRIGLMRVLLWSSITYGISNVLVLLFLINRGVSLSSSGIGLAVAGSAFATIGSILFLFLLQRYQVGIVVPLTALYPAVSVLLGILVLKEELKPVNALGILLALAAGYLLSR